MTIIEALEREEEIGDYHKFKKHRIKTRSAW